MSVLEILLIHWIHWMKKIIIMW